jgi:pimeloyl-ACP methyl ester carboxylesterase
VNRSMRIAGGLFGLLLLSSVASLAQGDDTTGGDRPVRAVADQMMQVTTFRGAGLIPVYVSLDGAPVDLSHPLPAATRALIIFHGKLRNADKYNASGLSAIRHAGDAGTGTLLVTPQFLSQVDVNAYHLPGNVLRWAPEAWMSGDDALNARVSSFDAIDAILAQLGRREIFPNLKTVIVAGHSAGGQVVQRYAVAGRSGDALTAAGVRVRYVIANPSSYLYFSPERPVLDAQGDFRFAPPAKTCFGRYNNWKYGIVDPPPYLGVDEISTLEQRYLRRDVLYLLGTHDTDPNHPALDKSCPGEVEGPYRLFRGEAYFRYLELRHPDLTQPSASQQLWLVPGVDHNGDKMLNSPCGLAALFGAGTCTTRVLNPTP